MLLHRSISPAEKIHGSKSQAGGDAIAGHRLAARARYTAIRAGNA
jgi:hypothetical protein